MRTKAIIMATVLVAAGAGLVWTGLTGADAAVAGEGGVRVGVYDTRFVAVAWGNTPEFREKIRAMKQEHAEAKAAGDTERVEELEELGPRMQERLHMQGFSNLPVDDILDGREAMLAEVAKEAGVDIIVANVAWQAAGVETVDVSIAIGRKLGCTEDLEEMLEQIKAAPPVELPFDFGDG